MTSFQAGSAEGPRFRICRIQTKASNQAGPTPDRPRNGELEPLATVCGSTLNFNVVNPERRDGGED